MSAGFLRVPSCRSADSAADADRIGHQSQDRQSAGPDDPTIDPWPRRRSDRMRRRQFATLGAAGGAAPSPSEQPPPSATAEAATDRLDLARAIDRVVEEVTGFRQWAPVPSGRTAARGDAQSRQRAASGLWRPLQADWKSRVPTRACQSARHPYPGRQVPPFICRSPNGALCAPFGNRGGDERQVRVDNGPQH